ncbi:MAG: hemin uptake protein HemP [Sneathiella sp.]|nr:hemin uptake protein HemP [Sneathiella sp.]
MVNRNAAPAVSDWNIAVKDHKIESTALFVGGRELSILHDGSEYKLRLTGNGKLILTK